ncbi:MAG: HtrA2 peptidase [Candidatus Daviesbacteria bacterium GW2011_GWC2_40_12]|uniref:HtrA2 peptidase n=1 Tax=Candidatus Daviesbacteria bacterium GW2011_GWC2_40_12 TaxID=1618431 RepID=A0A0G0QMS0_9BACT|nr:MAG: HtrA2 peptidase [Candidatus Daviesbacteria bacterium GW2011_GWF2_38_7]KKR15721.1 MAG: HtrA2 peptidase [Candidatus Daviesbacteria bacterium GW2011_GWA2_39_33]KKR41458.1 MAG: HtrA2 peptidase [Candidatus Daviesbacteria bacterium GW2011_GWC2_40_12]
MNESHDSSDYSLFKMDYSKLPKPNLSGIVAAVVLGLLVAVVLYQAQIRGLIPGLNIQLPKNLNLETRTLVSEENAVISAVEKTASSVVAIGATQRVFDPFDPFSAPRNLNSTIGTGFVVSDKGIIVTNRHVVSDSAARYTVVTMDGKKFEIKKIYRDPILDLAVVQIEGEKMQALEFGDSSKIKVGQTVIAIGNALGRFTNTVTTGVVSGMGRRVVAGDPFSGSSESLDDLIQTDAAINPGNSGGPLLNSAGQVIAVNVATTEGAQNIGFAIPINSVRKIVDEFIQKGSVSRPFLGINYRFISKDVAIMNEVPQGAYIQEVIERSSAQIAGIAAGDIITKIDGQAVDSETKISEIIRNKKIGDTLILTVWRDRNERNVTATLQELPSQ